MSTTRQIINDLIQASFVPSLKVDTIIESHVSKLEAELTKNRDAAGAMAHIIMEAGIVPGEFPKCRCDECRSVAISMDEAGYLSHVKDRWWR